MARMRIKEIAELAGVTPRAVRHYHRLGLLKAPPTIRGRREYGVEHLARLLRIRWLADGGLSLRQVAGILNSDPSDADRESADSTGSAKSTDSTLRDLHSVRNGIEEQRRILSDRARRVDELIIRVRRGDPLSPLPAVIGSFYDDVEARVRAIGGDTGSLRTERQLAAVLASRGMIPAGVGRLLESLGAEDRQECAGLLTRFARLTAPGTPSCDSRAQELANDTWRLALRHRTAVLEVLNDLPSGDTGRALWALAGLLLTIGYPRPAQRLFITRLLELLLADPHAAPAIQRCAGRALYRD